MQIQAVTQSPRRNHVDATTALRYATGISLFGPFLVARSPHGIAAILLGVTREQLVEDLRERFAVIGSADDSGLADIVDRVGALLANPAERFDLPLDPVGSDFQRLGMAGIAADRGRQNGQLCRHRPRYRQAHGNAGGGRGLAAPTRLPSPYPATAWCAATVVWVVIAGAWNVRRCCCGRKPAG